MVIARGEVVFVGGGVVVFIVSRGRGRGWVLRVFIWFLVCLYRVCFKVLEFRVELSIFLILNVFLVVLRRFSSFLKVGTGFKVNRSFGCFLIYLY